MNKPALKTSAAKNTATLLITCPDGRGIVAAVADFLYQFNANILHADQHQDAENPLVLFATQHHGYGRELPTQG